MLRSEWAKLRSVRSTFWALTVTEGLVLLVGGVLWLTSRGAIARGLAEGTAERAEAVLEA